MRFALIVSFKSAKRYNILFPFFNKPAQSFNKPSQSFNKLLTKFQQPITKART